ncbi:ATP-grasp fold amidoligase family protein [Aeromonas veronii]
MDLLLNFAKIIPLHVRLKLFYFLKFKRLLSLKNPKLLSEKIQKRKLNIIGVYSELADKIKVKQYVSKEIGAKHVIENIGIYRDINDVDFAQLPKSFVIKTNFGSGSAHIEIVRDKKNIVWDDIVKKFEKAMASEGYIGSILGETQYDSIERQLLIEKYMFNQVGDVIDLPDYKFHLFNGGEDGFLQVDHSRFTAHKRNIYSLDFKLLDAELMYPSDKFDLPDENECRELLNCAKALAKPFDYVRVDLYYVDKKIYFGEMTFTPGSGFESFSPTKYDAVFGAMWK